MHFEIELGGANGSVKSDFEKLLGAEAINFIKSMEMENELLRNRIEMYSKPLFGTHPTLSELLKYRSTTVGGLLCTGNKEENDEPDNSDDAN